MTVTQNPTDSFSNCLNCNLSDLTAKVTVGDAEKAHMVTIRESGQEIPFGYNNAAWERLLSQMQKGDELWEFNSDDQSWDSLAGRAGLALVRDGEVVTDIITMMN